MSSWLMIFHAAFQPCRRNVCTFGTLAGAILQISRRPAQDTRRCNKKRSARRYNRTVQFFTQGHVSAVDGRLISLWRIYPLLVMICVSLTNCGHEATLTRETATGGVATWSVQSDADVLSSAGRRDALRLIKDKCPNGSRIIKEGEIPKVSQIGRAHV